MTSQISSLTSAVYKSRGILLKQMQSQGYDVGDYSGFSVNEVNTMKTNNQLDMILEKLDEDPATKLKSKIYIRYYLAKALRPANLQEMIDDLFMVEEVLKKSDTLLIVVKDEMNETLINTLKHIWEQDKIFIVIQSLKRLQFNILEHILMPLNIRILDENGTKELMEQYHLKNVKEYFSIYLIIYNSYLFIN